MREQITMDDFAAALELVKAPAQVFLDLDGCGE